jgi:DNA-binding NarL/FixJ family response regulator
MKHKILIVEDELVLVRAILPTMQALYDVRFAQTVEGMREALRAEPFDMVLLDLDLGDINGLNGVDLIPEIQQTGAKVMVVSARYSGQMALACFRNGIRAFLDKRDAPEELLVVAAKVLAGQQWFSERWMRNLGEDTVPKLPPFERTELGVLTLLCQEPQPTNAVIAGTLHLSIGRVGNCLTGLFRMLGVDNRVELVKEVRRRGFLPEPRKPGAHRGKIHAGGNKSARG